ncbi:MAG TPA: carboxypeptidase-like regulatory domain-containing protein [Bryobacteraceae bacterium]|nr:carboxypeptidase-like regulatory domain-containing protein [Bryobacteraceae bacterium]
MATPPFSRLTVRIGIVLSLMGIAAFAQDTRGTIFGTVTDPSAAAVGGAKVEVVNTQTNVAVPLVTTESGYYQAPLLVAGTYRVTVEASGFKKSIREGIDLPVSSRVEVNVKLELGAVSDAVSVTAEAPLLNVDTISSGRVVESKSILDLGVPGGNTITLAKLAPGIQTTDSLSDKTVRLHSNGAGSRYYAWGGVGASLAGGGGNDWYIDGMSNYGNGGVGYMPAPELVQEFKIESSGFDANVGHGVGVTVQVMTKNGTNQLHGMLRETHHQFQWDALDFFTKQTFFNRINQAVAAGNNTLADQLRAQGGQVQGRENTFAATLGGPVYIPKVFNGKNKLFFFFGYSGFRVGQYRQSYNAVPTLDMRQGDFSSLLPISSTLYQVYDPLTVAPDPTRAGHFVRQPFPGNKVPVARINNPMYKFYSDLLPAPNSYDSSVEPNRDYTAYSSPYSENYNQYANRFDYNVSEKDRVFVRWNWSQWQNTDMKWLYQSTIPDILSGSSIRANFGAGIDWVHTFGPNLLLDVAVSHNIYRNQGLDPGFQKLSPSSLGLPSYMDTQASSSMALPNVTWSGWTTVNGSNSVYRDRLLGFKADLMRTTASHTIKFGFDGRGQYYNGSSSGANAGTFNFTSMYTQRTDDGFQSAGTGNYAGSWAAFMMGLPTTSQLDINSSQALLNPYYAWYVQENWRASRKLSLNLGLRVEYEMGPTERFNRALGGFDPTAQLPITAEAQAAYAASPIPQLPASQFQVLGAPSYVGVNGADRKIWGNSLMWEPRLAVAYQINSRTVLRAGAGRFYDTFNVMNLTGSGVSTPVNQTGFSQQTATTYSNDFGQTWLTGNPYNGVSPLTDPFPVLSSGSRFLQPVGSALGAMAVIGQNYTFWPYDRPHTRQNRWRLDVQRQLGQNMVLDVAYAGSYTDHGPMNQTIGAVPAQYYNYSNTRNDAVANAMNANVTNPFYIGNFADLKTSNPTVYNYMASNSFFTSKTARVSQLVQAFPQMTSSFREQAPQLKAKTEETDISFERRFSKGWNLQVAYTRLWNYTADYFPNPFDTSPAWEPSNLGAPHRLTATSVVQTPFGKGRRWFQSGPASWILGGYQFTVIYELQPGPLLTWSPTVFYNGSDVTAVCDGGGTFGQWFNTSGFVTAAAQNAAAFQAAVFPREINGNGGCRASSLNNWNMNAARDFRIKERATLTLRFDVYNLQNRSQFSPANTSPTSTDFGKVTSVVAINGAGGGSINRWVTVQARLTF